MIAQLELDWLGGWSERRLRRRRPGVERLPWGTLTPGDQPPAQVAQARRVWTNAVFTEYASAAAFGNLATALLECGAPVDLSAVAADIVVDELAHVELVSRLVMELGGAVPYHADLGQVSQVTDATASPLMRALELAITISCVGETLSVDALTRSRALTEVPLIHAVLDRLVRDEGPHAELGLRILAWAEPRLSAGDRERLAAIALAAIAVYAPSWQADADLDGAGALAPLTAGDRRATVLATIEQRIVARLARCGVALDRARLAAIVLGEAGAVDHSRRSTPTDAIQ